MGDMKAFERECEAFFRPLWPGEDKILVFGDGNSDRPPIMLIGEAPGEQETLKRRPFVGKAGKNLDEFLQLMGMERETLFVSNVVKIRPTSLGKTGRVRNRAPSKEEIALFLPFLMKEIDLVKPQCLVTLGNVPLKALMGPKATVGDLHGRWHTAANGLPLFALYHPAAIIYRRELKEVYAQDVLQLKASLTIGTSK
ncbi:MAG: uracil-DNA glycosylase [Clostridia bacterium]|nr:uracil-DNA glycosylase [Clostridia bacterium]